MKEAYVPLVAQSLQSQLKEEELDFSSREVVYRLIFFPLFTSFQAYSFLNDLRRSADQ